MYEKERQDGVPCGMGNCDYWTIAFEQNCGAQHSDGSPAVEACEDYEPEGLDAVMGED